MSISSPSNMNEFNLTGWEVDDRVETAQVRAGFVTLNEASFPQNIFIIRDR